MQVLGPQKDEGLVIFPEAGLADVLVVGFCPGFLHGLLDHRFLQLRLLGLHVLRLFGCPLASYKHIEAIVATATTVR
jgi:hypothetical protein